MTLGERLKESREFADLKQVNVAKMTQISNKTLSNWEKNVSKPDTDSLKILADIYNVTTDYLLGRSLIKTHSPIPNDLPPLNAKEERDIARDLEEIMKLLSCENADGKNTISFYGQPVSDEDRETIRISIEASLRIAKQMAKKKFTPQKAT